MDSLFRAFSVSPSKIIADLLSKLTFTFEPRLALRSFETLILKFPKKD
jgi:hypothetical protein